MRRARILERIPPSQVPIASGLGALLLLLALGRGSAAAAEAKGSVDKIKVHYQAAAAAYDDGDFEETKSQLQEAISLSKGAGASAGKVVAQSYLLFGVLEVAGFKHPDTGVRYFAKALDLSPAIQVPPSMATKDVLAAFERAENQTPPAAETTATHEPAHQEPAAQRRRASPSRRSRGRTGARDLRSRRSAPTAGARARSKRDREERDKLVDELAQAKIGESQSEADKRKLQQDLQDRDRQLAETKGRLAQVEKEKREQDQQLTESRGPGPDAGARRSPTKTGSSARPRRAWRSSKRRSWSKNGSWPPPRMRPAERATPTTSCERRSWRATASSPTPRPASSSSPRKNRTPTSSWPPRARPSSATTKPTTRLDKAKLESDRQLADAKARLLQLTKEKQDTDRQLATTRDGEKKERDSREKLEKVWQDSQARDKERRNHDEQARLEREKLEEGPALPSHFAEPIYCTVPDEIPAGADLFVHCLPHPNVGAKVVALYYRAGGTVLYNATTMERSKKGWYTAVIPGSRVTGKLLHYYVEARDGRQAVAASNGKAASPNIAMIRTPRGNN